jgi:PIN domain nuclease of toxin-antitoxin system
MTVRILLDTHIFLWLASGSRHLTSQAKALIDGADEIFISSATIWEVAIKMRLGKLAADPEDLIKEMERNGFEELPVFARHAKEVARLPLHHTDPFDRLLLAQAMTEPMQLLTADAGLSPYSSLVVVV